MGAAPLFQLESSKALNRQTLIGFEASLVPIRNFHVAPSLIKGISAADPVSLSGRSRVTTTRNDRTGDKYFILDFIILRCSLFSSPAERNEPLLSLLRHSV